MCRLPLERNVRARGKLQVVLRANRAGVQQPAEKVVLSINVQRGEKARAAVHHERRGYKKPFDGTWKRLATPSSRRPRGRWSKKREEQIAELRGAAGSSVVSRSRASRAFVVRRAAASRMRLLLHRPTPEASSRALEGGRTVPRVRREEFEARRAGAGRGVRFEGTT